MRRPVARPRTRLPPLPLAHLQIRAALPPVFFTKFYVFEAIDVVLTPKYCDCSLISSPFCNFGQHCKEIEIKAYLGCVNFVLRENVGDDRIALESLETWTAQKDKKS